MTVIIKLGGSLLAKGRELVLFLGDYAETNALAIVILPGGGPFAEVVREFSDQNAISDDAAHWMAVLAMHEYGFFLADDNPEIPVVESIDEIQNAGPICIVLPYKILKDDDSLPHTWEVTSDTIAAFVAEKLGEKSFIKVTDVDGMLDEDGSLITRIHAEDMVEKGHKGCVDAELPGFLLQHDMRCVIVNGHHSERIIGAIEEEETVCTKLVSDIER